MFFKSDEAQIRVLDFDKSGNLIAGTDGSGLIYRISPQGEGFVLYSAPKKEITALAIDAQGNIYAAGAGDKRGGAASASAGRARRARLQRSPRQPSLSSRAQRNAGCRSGHHTHSISQRDEPRWL